MEAIVIALIVISGYLVDTDNECVAPEMQVIAHVETTSPGNVSTEAGCYHDTKSGEYWRTNSLVSDAILEQTSLVKHENCAFIDWNLCEHRDVE